MTPNEIIIKNGNIIDPLSGMDGKKDVLIRGGKIESVADSIDAGTCTVIEAAGYAGYARSYRYACAFA